MSKRDDKLYLLFRPKGDQFLVRQMRWGKRHEVKGFFSSKAEGLGVWGGVEVGKESRCVQRQRGKMLQVSQKRQAARLTNRNS